MSMAMKERSMGLIKKIKRETLFIKDVTGKVYLPRPSGWISGWMRHLWFEKKTGVKPTIASPDFWSDLSNDYKTMRLLEYEDGQHEVINETW